MQAWLSFGIHKQWLLAVVVLVEALVLFCFVVLGVGLLVGLLVCGFEIISVAVIYCLLLYVTRYNRMNGNAISCIRGTSSDNTSYVIMIC